MNRILLLAVALQSPALLAQNISLSGQTGPTGVLLNTVLNGNPHQTSLPPSTTLPTPWLLFDSQSWSGGGFGAEGSAERTTSSAGHRLLRYQVGATGGVIDPATSGNASAAAEVRFGLSSVRPQLGTVVLRYHSTGSGTGSLDVRVDIGLDGVDFTGGANQAPIVRSFPAAIGQSGLTIQVTGTATTSLSGRGNVGYSGFLELEFVPQASTLAYGTPCPYALEADTGSTATTDTFALQAHGPALSVAILALGATQLSVPIPPSNCLLLVDPLVLLVLPLDVQGNGAVDFTVAHQPGLSFLAQALIPLPGMSGWEVRTSNGQQFTVH
jgi:hypothetical protein